MCFVCYVDGSSCAHRRSIARRYILGTFQWEQLRRDLIRYMIELWTLPVRRGTLEFYVFPIKGAHKGSRGLLVLTSVTTNRG